MSDVIIAAKNMRNIVNQTLHYSECGNLGPTVLSDNSTTPVQCPCAHQYNARPEHQHNAPPSHRRCCGSPVNVGMARYSAHRSNTSVKSIVHREAAEVHAGSFSYFGRKHNSSAMFKCSIVTLI